VAGRALRALLQGASPVDPVALAGTAAILLATAALTALPSVVRTIRLDPAAVLREE
jgi:hypothetical protein